MPPDPGLPILVKVDVPQTDFDPGAIDTEVYCVNNTALAWQVSAASNSFTTVDDDTGAAVHHGSPPSSVRLEPGQAARIADVAGWEWDGHVGLEVEFREAGSDTVITKTYSLKNGGEACAIPSIGKAGTVVPPDRP